MSPKRPPILLVAILASIKEALDLLTHVITTPKVSKTSPSKKRYPTRAALAGDGLLYHTTWRKQPAFALKLLDSLAVS